MRANKKFAAGLSARAKNGLIGCYGDRDIIYQPEKTVAGRDRLTLARNIGAKSLHEIAFLLCKYGFIDNIEKWFHAYSTNANS